MIRGHCMQVLLNYMNHDPDWDNTSESHDPLNIIKLIEKQYWIIPKINIVVQQFPINIVHCMDSTNTT